MAQQCPHLLTSVRPLAAPDLNQLMSVPQCDVCGKSAAHLWLCLYKDCYMLGCDNNNGNSEADHSSEHYQSHPEHHIQLNIRSRRAWCYGCNSEVNTANAIIGGGAVLTAGAGSTSLAGESPERFGKVLKPKLTDHFVAKPPADGPTSPGFGEQDERRHSHRKRRHVGGLVGLSNLGNTCYMNAALQCLSNVPALTEFFLRCPALVSHNNADVQSREKPGLSKAYLQHVTDIWKTYRKSEGHYIAPSKVSFAFRMAHPMFRGFHQHDSQEFLRCFMDQMHEELMEPAWSAETASEDDELESVSEAESNPNEDAKSYQSGEDLADQEYETADSGVSEQSSSTGGGLTSLDRKRKRKLSMLSAVSAPDRASSSQDHQSDPMQRRHVSLSDPELERPSSLNPSDIELEFADAGSSVGSMSPPANSRRLNIQRPMRLTSFSLHKRKQKTYRSIISDVFDGKLVSSVQCLTCDRVSMTTETFQDLSLPIPSQETLEALRSQQISSTKNSSPAMSANNEGWVSWIWSWLYGFLYGPNITLEDCLAYFFSADELKGDNMYSCEKCKNDSKKNCSKTDDSLTNDSERNSLTGGCKQSCSTNDSLKLNRPTKDDHSLSCSLYQSTAVLNSQKSCSEINSQQSSSEMKQICLQNSNQSKESDPQNEGQNAEKGKKLRNGLKYSRVTVLPDTLCIHLKRFRHEFAFSSKVSTKVTFPLVDLDMSPWLHADCISKESSYDLIGIICHHGTAGGGHYTSYALNPVNTLWYEFDDSCVTQVEDACVLNAEAYVLFYRKVNDKIEPVRSEMHQLLEEAQTHPSLLQFYVSRQWINKLENVAEPGPIDNSDFLCRHGGVLPQKSDYVYDLCVAFPQPVWDLLHSQFGGGPACTRLYECSQCRNDLDALTKQKSFELDEFKRLHEEFQEQSGQASHVFCLSSSWFKHWEGFVTGRIRDPPGPIDNKAIVTNTVTRNASGAPLNIQMLRHSSDFVQISHDIWLLFHSIYGGGPEVIVRPNGSSQVTHIRIPSLPAITSRMRAKSLSEMTSGLGASPSSSQLKI